MFRPSQIICTVLVLAYAAAAGADVVDLDSLAHGTNVRDQFLASDGLTVRAVNFNKPAGDAHNLAVIFDTTTNPNLGDGDNDLRSPWDTGNLPSNHVVGKVLIIQERTGANDIVDADNDNVPEYVHVPDDEGGRPAGAITLSWVNGCLIDAISFTLVDVELDAEPFKVTFANDLDSTTVMVNHGGDYGHGAVALGNNSVNRVSMLASVVGIGAWTRVTFEFGGSGGVGEIEFIKLLTIPVVPAPAALPAGALGMLALAARRRRAARFL